MNDEKIDITVEHDIINKVKQRFGFEYELRLHAPEAVKGFRLILEARSPRPIRVLETRPFRDTVRGNEGSRILIEVLLFYDTENPVTINYKLAGHANRNVYSIVIPYPLENEREAVEDNQLVDKLPLEVIISTDSNETSSVPPALRREDDLPSPSDTLFTERSDLETPPTLTRECDPPPLSADSMDYTEIVTAPAVSEAALENMETDEIEELEQTELDGMVMHHSIFTGPSTSNDPRALPIATPADDETQNKKKNRSTKKNACLFCAKLYTKIGEHLMRAHKKEPQVAEISAIEKQSNDNPELKQQYINTIRQKYSAIVAEGNLKYNKSIRENGGTEFIPKYKTNAAVAVGECAPCVHCNHLYTARSLHRHKCIFNYKENKIQLKVPIIRISRANWTVSNSIELTKGMKALLSGLRQDEFSETLRGEEILIKFGEEWLAGLVDVDEDDEDEDDEDEVEVEEDEEVGFNDDFDVNKEEKLARLRQILRDLARFLTIFRSLTDADTPLSDLFDAKYEKEVRVAVKKYCHNYTAPHTAYRLHRSLGKFMKFFIHNLSGIEEEDIIRTRKLRKIRTEKFEHNWTMNITPKLSAAKSKKKTARIVNVPTDEELAKFNDYVNSNLKIYLKKNIKSYKDYLELCKLTYSRLTSMNFRRSGEVARMSIAQFHQRQKNGPISSKATKIEKLCAEFFEVVTLKGKSSRNEVVTAILPPNCVQAIQKILTVRKRFKELKKNEFVFGVVGIRSYHIVGPAVIKKMAERAEISSRFTASNMRRYIATQMIWRNVSVNIRKILTSHMGHQLATHENVYTEHLKTDSPYFYKIPAMLMNVEAGNATKSLEEVTDDDVAEYIENSCMEVK